MVSDHEILCAQRSDLRQSPRPADLAQHLPHGLFRILLNIIHVSLDDLNGMLCDQLVHQLDALLVGGHLRAKVGQVLVEVARAHTGGFVGSNGNQRRAVENGGDARLVEL